MIEFRNPVSRDIPGLRQLWQDAFSETEAFIDWFISTAYSPDRCRVASENGELLAALYWFDCSLEDRPLAYIYGVATSPKHRNRGIASKLMADTHAHLKELGYHAAVLVPGGPELFRFYERLGYTTAGFVDECVIAAGAPVPIREIAPAEYGALRCRLLPPGGIVQEGENLTFLDGLARLYAGEGFIAALSRDEKPFGMELLGDPNAAPGILGALGIEEALFRIPGDRKPFAMVHPFGELSGPVWFGLAFD